MAGGSVGLAFEGFKTLRFATLCMNEQLIDTIRPGGEEFGLIRLGKARSFNAKLGGNGKVIAPGSGADARAPSLGGKRRGGRVLLGGVNGSVRLSRLRVGRPLEFGAARGIGVRLEGRIVGEGLREGRVGHFS